VIKTTIHRTRVTFFCAVEFMEARKTCYRVVKTFAFRPSGSAMAALVALLHTVGDMLSTNSFVYVIALDFLKAFDSVCHSTLMDKMAQLAMPDQVYNSIRAFFYERYHCAKFAGEVSPLVDITAGVVQGSSIGPASYIVTAADLWPKRTGNAIVKFADDTYLIIPAANSHTRKDEVSYVETWAARNNLHLNCAKSHEIVFRSRKLRGKAIQPAPPCSGIERVDEQTILGVVVNSKFTATDYVSSLLDSCSSLLLHALRVLRTHGLPSQSLKDVFHATVIGKWTYCAPAWHGFYLASDYTRLNSFLRRAVKLGYYDKQSATITDLFDDADDAFFRKILYNKEHVLHPYLPE